MAFFVPEVGLLAAMRLPDLKRNGPFISVAAIVLPGVGGWLGITSGRSSRGATVFATLAVSASDLAALAAVRVAIPEANIGMCVAATLGITFPLSLTIGIMFTCGAWNDSPSGSDEDHASIKRFLPISRRGGAVSVFPTHPMKPDKSTKIGPKP